MKAELEPLWHDWRPALYLVITYICVILIYKTKRRIDDKKLNEELADFKAKHEALEQKLSAEVDNQDQYRADYRELKNIESDIEATENMIRLSAINPDHLNQVAIESWNKGVKEFEFSILKLQEDYETTKQKLKKK